MNCSAGSLPAVGTGVPYFTLPSTAGNYVPYTLIDPALLARWAQRKEGPSTRIEIGELLTQAPETHQRSA